MGWAHIPDLEWGRRPKLHGMQVLMARIGLAVPGRPIGPWVAEDRSAGGVRDQTGPEPAVARWRWSVLGPQPKGEPRTTAGRSGHRTFIGTAGSWTYSLLTWGGGRAPAFSRYVRLVR
jgi:hypothetical protein